VQTLTKSVYSRNPSAFGLEIPSSFPLVSILKPETTGMDKTDDTDKTYERQA